MSDLKLHLHLFVSIVRCYKNDFKGVSKNTLLEADRLLALLLAARNVLFIRAGNVSVPRNRFLGAGEEVTRPNRPI